MVFKGCIFVLKVVLGDWFQIFVGLQRCALSYRNVVLIGGVRDFLGRGRLVLNVFVNLLQLVLKIWAPVSLET